MSAYASDPAPPILAHSLLSQQQHPTGTNSGPGSLSQDTAIKEGIQCSLDASFHGGIVIGFSRLKRKGRYDDHDQEYLGQVPRYFLANHIRRNTTSTSSGQYSTFIIHPIHYHVFSPQNLLASLLSPTDPNQQQPLSRDEAISRLDSVQLLPVFDFPAAVQAINHVSNVLHRIGEERHHEKLDERDNHRPVVLVIAGLDTLIEGVVRTSNPIKGTAMLSATMQTLTHLSRAYASFLSVVLVNATGLGSGSGPGASADPPEGTYPVRGETEERLSLLLSSLLLKALDQGIDIHLVVSREGGRRIVEILKDRVGDGASKTCVWW